MFSTSIRALGRGILAAALLVSPLACGGTPKPPPDPELDADPPLGDQAGIEQGAAQNDYQRGVAYVENGKWDEAKLLLTKVTTSTPKNADAHAYLGFVMEQLQDPAAAESSYKEALVQNPGQVMAAQNLSGMYLSAKPARIEDALKVLDAALKTAPNEVGLLQNLGHARAAKGDVAGSAKAFQAAIAKADSLELRFAIANVYFDAKQFQDAVPHAKKILTLAKDDPKAFASAGFMLEYGGAFAECVTAFDKALAIKNKEADWLLRRGRCKDRSGNEDAAVEDFNAALRIKPDFAAAYYHLGLIQHNQQKLQSAEFSFQKAVEHGKGTAIGKLATAKLNELHHGKP